MTANLRYFYVIADILLTLSPCVRMEFDNHDNVFSRQCDF